MPLWKDSFESRWGGLKRMLKDCGAVYRDNLLFFISIRSFQLSSISKKDDLSDLNLKISIKC